ncbi:CXADR-like membrane protein isoform X2 [Gambusia affinis]|uniref:CXADR-like membrane protein isoform X1 n=1 Tax=Gambusia affinis TaxID=33528 RepID=UPI001CDB8CD6|nr:CXADR-like membrane protein isoform X1 [Gambusia affinis]XP_043963404.1 CXADR-like membrane protein isoform X2 [Gambusia affinis]
MAKLEVFLLFVLQLEGISGDDLHFYHTVGDDVVLPCVDPSSSCLRVNWLYNDIIGSTTKNKVTNGNINQKSVNAARLSLNTDCSLMIKNIIPEDAGRYTCRTGNRDSIMNLNILSISPSQPAGDATKDGNINLQCSLWRYLATRCSDNRLIWVNDTGTELVGEDVTDQKSSLQIQCVSSLTVKPLNNRYTCQLIQGNRMKVEAHYLPLSTDETQTYSIYIIGVVLAVGLLLLLAAIAAVLINCRRRTKQSDEPKNSNSDVRNANNQIHQNAESPSTMTYASIGHFTPNSPLRVTVQQHEVTYSAVKPKMETDFDPNSLYSRVSKPE